MRMGEGESESKRKKLRFARSSLYTVLSGKDLSFIATYLVYFRHNVVEKVMRAQANDLAKAG